MQSTLTQSAAADLSPASFSLPETDRAPGISRRLLESVLADWLICSECMDSAQLLLSELVTNAVHHGRGPAHITVTRESSSGTPCALRIAVADTSAQPARRRRTAGFDENGRGLAIVDVLSDRWGQDVLAEGKIIWFEIGRLCNYASGRRGTSLH